MDEIYGLRKRIDIVDREITRLLDIRMNIVREISIYKKKHGRAIRDPFREKEILDKAGKYREIFREIIRASIKYQNEFLVADRNKDMPSKKIGIVGYGKMGRLFSEILGEHHEISVFDIREVETPSKIKIHRNLNELIKDAEYILVATPLNKTSIVLEEIRKEIIKDNIQGKIVFDIATLKDRVMPILKKYPSDTKVCSIHPLFGNSIKSIEGKSIVIIPIENRERECEEVVKLLKPYGFNLFMSTQEIHDTAIGYTVGIPYFIAVTYGETLIRKNIGEISRYGGTSYQYLMNYLENIVLEDEPDFIVELINNKLVGKVIRELIETIDNRYNNRYITDIEKILKKLRELKKC